MSDTDFSRTNALAWMRLEVERARHGENTYDVADASGDLSPTLLAESCAQHFDVKDEDGPLDDESHWIWEVAVDVVEELEAVDREEVDGER